VKTVRGGCARVEDGVLVASSGFRDTGSLVWLCGLVYGVKLTSFRKREVGGLTGSSRSLRCV
jgi:hypothetical protein